MPRPFRVAYGNEGRKVREEKRSWEVLGQGRVGVVTGVCSENCTGGLGMKGRETSWRQVLV